MNIFSNHSMVDKTSALRSYFWYWMPNLLMAFIDSVFPALGNLIGSVPENIQRQRVD